MPTIASLNFAVVVGLLLLRLFGLECLFCFSKGKPKYFSGTSLVMSAPASYVAAEGLNTIP
jgi:hypothetical protein